MEPIHAKVKKWGNSLGLIIPKNAARQIKLKPGQEIDILVVSHLPRAKDILPVFTGLKITGQQVKNLARKELW